MTRHLFFFSLVLLLIPIVTSSGAADPQPQKGPFISLQLKTEISDDQPTLPMHDALVKAKKHTTPTGVSSVRPVDHRYATSEYLMGDIAVSVLFLESNGSIDPSTEDWTNAEKERIIERTNSALGWWEDQSGSSSAITFRTEFHTVETSYEPIKHPQTEEGLWIKEALTTKGYNNGSDYFEEAYDYVNDLRNRRGTEWAFIAFVVDSSADIDGSFSDGQYSAYAYLGGPFLVTTFDNGGWGVDRYNQVIAHEIGHIFYATDEYNGEDEWSGYLYEKDDEGSGKLMDTATLSLSDATRNQIGWRDSNANGVPDVLDMSPTTTVDLITNNLETDEQSSAIVAINVSSTIGVVQNRNSWGPRVDVTTSTFTGVEYRVGSSGLWYFVGVPTSAEVRSILVNISKIFISGPHTIYLRSVDSSGLKDLNAPNVKVTFTLDMTEPVISPVQDTLVVNQSNSGYQPLIWNVQDTFLSHYSVHINGSLVEQKAIGGTEHSITYQFPNNATFGSHEVLLFVNDTRGNSRNTTSTVLVVDVTRPTLVGQVIFLQDHDDVLVVTWTATDLNPSFYYIRRNNLLVRSGPWLGGVEMQSKLDDEPMGEHNYTLTILDLSNNEITVSQILKILDTQEPTLVEEPANLTFSRGEEIEIQWVWADLNPQSYQLYLNGSLALDGEWLSLGPITVQLTNLTGGNYDLKLVVEDSAGNEGIYEGRLVVLVEEQGSNVRSSILALMVGALLLGRQALKRRRKIE